MLPYPRCPSCRSSLGHIAAIYFEIRRERILKQCKDRGISYDTSFTELDIAMGDVLDDLKIEHSCCRSHMIGQLRITDFN